MKVTIELEAREVIAIGAACCWAAVTASNIMLADNPIVAARLRSKAVQLLQVSADDANVGPTELKDLGLRLCELGVTGN